MKHTWKRLLAVLLAVSVLLTLALPGFAVNDEDKPEVTWEKIETTQRRSHVGTGVDLTREPAPVMPRAQTLSEPVCVVERYMLGWSPSSLVVSASYWASRTTDLTPSSARMASSLWPLTAQ